MDKDKNKSFGSRENRDNRGINLVAAPPDYALQFMDMIAGICSVAFFGEEQKNSKTIPGALKKDKSVFVGLHESINEFRDYIKNLRQEKTSENSSKNTIATINSPISVHIASISDDIYKRPFIVQLIENDKLSKMDVEKGTESKILLEIANVNNVESLEKSLKKLTSGDNITQIDALTYSVVSFLSQLKYLNEEFRKINSIEIDIPDLTNITNFIEKISSDDFKIKLFINDEDKQLFNNIDDLVTKFTAFYTKLSSIGKIDLDVSNIQTFVSSLETNINKLQGFDTKKIKELLNLFTDNDVTGGTISIMTFVEQLQNFEFDDNDITEFTKGVGALNNALNTEILTKLKTTLNKISDEFNGVNLGSIAGIGNIVDAIIKIISVNIDKINIKQIKQISNLLKENGLVNDIFNSLSDITKFLESSELTKARNALANMSNLIEILIKTSEIGILDRIRIKLNFSFLKNYIVNELPSIITLINKTFTEDPKDISGLYNISNFIRQITSIGEISIKNKIRMKMNLFYIKEFLLEDVLNTYNQIIEFFKSTSGDYELINHFTNVLDNIVNSLKIDDSEIIKSHTALLQLNSVIFKSKIPGSLSIEGFLSKLENIKFNSDSIKNTSNEIENAIDIIISIIDKITDNIGEDSNKQTLDDLIKSIVISPQNEKQFDKTQKFLKRTVELQDLLNTISSYKYTKGIDKIFEKEANAIKSISDSFADIDPNKLKHVIELFKSFNNLIIVASLTMVLGAYAMSKIDIKNLITFTLTLGIFVWGMSKIISSLSKLNYGVIENSINIISALNELILMSSFALIFGSLAMNWIEIANLMAFTTCLGVFILGMTLALKLLSSIEFKNEIFNNIKSFSLSVAILGATLVLGSLFMKIISPADLAKFILATGLFIVGLAVVFKVFNKLVKTILTGIKDLALAVMAIGLTLALGAFIVQNVDITTIMGFGFILAVFIASITIPLAIFKASFKVMMKGVHELSLVILAATVSMLIGAYFVREGWGEYIFKFAFILSGFIIALGLALRLAGILLGGEHTAKTLKQLTWLVVTSTIVMLIGAYFVREGWAMDILKFTAMLGIFIIGIGFAMRLATQFVKKETILAMFALSLLVLIAGAVMVAGPILLKMKDVGYDDVFLFTICLAGFLIGMSVVLLILGEIANESEMILFKGGVLMAGIGVLIFGMSYLISKSYEYLKDVDLWDFALRLGELIVICGIFGAIIAAIGFAATAGAPLLAAGAAFMAGVIGIIYGLSKAVQEMVIASKMLELLVGTDIEYLLEPVQNFIIAISDTFSQYDKKKLLKVYLGIKAIRGLGNTIGEIALGIGMMASLRIPKYDPNGKIIGTRPMDKKDFVNAAESVQTIITCVGGAIMSLFGVGPNAQNVSKDQKEIIKEMMSTQWGVFGGKTKFEKIINATSKLGDLVANIAKGVQEMANLRMPLYDTKTGKVIGSAPIKPEDFTSAAKNIATLITVIGASIMALYEGKTVEIDANGNMQFVNAAGLTPEIAKEMFQTGDGVWDLLSGKTKFEKVLGSSLKLGELIKNLAEGISAYASLKFPKTYNEKGEVTSYHDMTDLDAKIAAAGENIGKVILAIGGAVSQLASDPNFEKGFFESQTAVERVVNQLSPISNFLVSMTEIISAYATGEFVTFEEKTNKDGSIEIVKRYKKLPANWNTELQKNVKMILLSFANAMSEAFNPTDKTERQKMSILLSKSTTIHSMIQNISELGTAMSSLFGIISQIRELNIVKETVDLWVVQPYNKFIEIFTTNNSLDFLLNKLDDNLKTNTDRLSQITADLLTSFTNIKDIIGLELKIDNDPLNGVLSMISNNIDILKQISLEKTDISGIKLFMTEVDNYIKIMQKIDADFIKNVNLFKSSIKDIYNLTLTIKKGGEFANHQQTLKEYVETINSIDVSKTESLITLVGALSSLGDKVDGLDKFTETLSVRLSGVLEKLTRQIVNAENTIKSADKLHVKRQMLINNSVKTIKELMQQEMTVNLKKAEDDMQNPTILGGGGTGESTDTSSTTGGATFESTPATETTESAPAAPQYKSQKSTVEVVINYQKLGQEIAKAIKLYT